MAADVSSLVQILGGGGCKDDQHRPAVNDSTREKPVALITRDLLGGTSNCVVESQDLDLDLPVPSGWEKRLDLESGKVYIQRCDTSSLPSMSEQKLQMNHEGTSTQLKLNSPLKAPLNLFDETSLDLKLVSSSNPSSNNYQSVCTLDKVKSALERAEKEPIKKRNSLWKPLSSPSPSSYSSSSSSMREAQEEESEERLMSSPVAAGCPGCLSYVLITKINPKCPRCKSVVPFPSMKKPRIDLNISI
ncbi:uncharacterized protein LOC129314317 [Prosopis cineraria]|uniref:uncharacterized protein LOC129314317 n=1 Tax=Prosopis cineraria TaxID=364024 RepID=UPI00240EC438|nr:uncharacterized protein LOC129314317 [Prosopis cineraria]